MEYDSGYSREEAELLAVQPNSMAVAIENQYSTCPSLSAINVSCKEKLFLWPKQQKPLLFYGGPQGDRSPT